MSDSRTLAEILADPNTPQWIIAGVNRIRQTSPVYAAFLEAMHDRRAKQRHGEARR